MREKSEAVATSKRAQERSRKLDNKRQELASASNELVRTVTPILVPMLSAKLCNGVVPSAKVGDILRKRVKVKR